MSSLGHFIRRLEEREFRERGAENLKINETPNHLQIERVFFFSSFLMGEEGLKICRILIYKCILDKGFSNSRLGRAASFSRRDLPFYPPWRGEAGGDGFCKTHSCQWVRFHGEESLELLAA